MTLTAPVAPGGTGLVSRKMTLGIMQPYFFPYLGYFDLIARTDQWVVFDTAQYRRKSWMNRNRILHPTEGWQYVTVPVTRDGQETAIRDVRLQDPEATRKRVLGQIAHYRRDAPHHAEVEDLVDRAFRRTTRGTLAELNVQGLAAVCDYLALDFDFKVGSELDLAPDGVEHAGQWALVISAALGATDYLNPAGGRSLFRKSEFDARGIRLRFAEAPACHYGCGRRRFIEDLSIIDVLMWNDASTVRSWLGRREP